MVSVIIPCHNVGKYVSACLDSVLQQTVTGVEIICVNDGSSDNTDVLLREYSNRYPEKIQVITQNNQGASAARNKGLQSARGAYIQFLDADDRLLPDKIAEQIKIASDSNPDIIVGNFIRLENGAAKKITHSEDVWIGLVIGRLGSTCSNLWKKQSLIDAGMWDDVKSSQEAHLMFKMLKKGAMIRFDEHYNTEVTVRVENSISSLNRKENWMRYIDLRLAIWEYLSGTKQLHEPILRELKINVFDSIRILHSYDPVNGLNYYSRHVRGRYRPLASRSTSFLYIFLLRLFGFRMAQLLSRAPVS